jgi:hypothetical protein
MNIYLFFQWRRPAPTYLTCREQDIRRLKTAGFVQAREAGVLAKITRPETDMETMIGLTRRGVSFYGNIESTDESGPALIVGNPGELILIASDDDNQPVISVREDGLLVGVDAARAYWRELVRAKDTIRPNGSRETVQSNGSGSERVRQKLTGLRAFLRRR